MVIINPNAPSVSNLGSNRADGQVESTQVDARQSQSARRPEVTQQPTATQTATAANPAQNNNGIPLLNNRDQAVSDAIRRAAIASDDGIANNQSAAQQSAALNQAQAVAPSDTLQRLAAAAQERVGQERIGNGGPQAAAPSQTVAEQVAPPPAPAQAAAQAQGFQDLVNVAPPQLPETAAPAAQQATAERAPQEAPQFTPPPSAFEVLQSSQERLNDVLLPDFANFIGLRASLPAQAQTQGQVRATDTQEPPPPPPQPVDVKV